MESEIELPLTDYQKFERKHRKEGIITKIIFGSVLLGIGGFLYNSIDLNKIAEIRNEKKQQESIRRVFLYGENIFRDVFLSNNPDNFFSINEVKADQVPTYTIQNSQTENVILSTSAGNEDEKGLEKVLKTNFDITGDGNYEIIEYRINQGDDSGMVYVDGEEYLSGRLFVIDSLKNGEEIKPKESLFLLTKTILDNYGKVDATDTKEGFFVQPNFYEQYVEHLSNN